MLGHDANGDADRGHGAACAEVPVRSSSSESWPPKFDARDTHEKDGASLGDWSYPIVDVECLSDYSSSFFLLMMIKTTDQCDLTTKSSFFF